MSRIRQIRVPAPSGSYTVSVGPDLLGQLGQLLPESLRGRKMALITNDTVGALYGKKVVEALGRIGPVRPISIPDGERYKSMPTATRLYADLIRDGLDRSGVVVALGGGVIGDLAGFVAATYLRGVRFVQIPTTLLAQVDASIGGKVAVNLREGKNLVGAFHQPVAVVADTRVLSTLPPRQLGAGMMEVVKYALLGDLHLWDYLKTHAKHRLDLDVVVEASVRDKARIVAADEREAGHRRVLNLGHTLGHALETVTGYRRYLHGEAVGIGIVFANLVAHRMRRQSNEHLAEVVDLLRLIGLEISLP
ncbi:MAG: 3-dehydroquinate synthase, partial [Candidatus Riflebacteria bacterium]|nr:3-dehydroquinate synthase [Candidatus Riflebacteria bacterium]